MNNLPTLFRFEGKPLNVQMDESGNLIFSAPDVCRALGLSDVTSALRALDADEKGPLTVRTPGGDQVVNGITEPGIYKLIGKSRKPEARRFDRWVRHEVLPTIRKTGSYIAPISREEQLARAVLLSNEMLKEKDEEIAALTPKADGFDRLANSTGRTNLREVGKVLQIGSQRGIEMLREIKWTYRDQAGRWHAYADKIDAGLLEVKFHTFTNTSGEERSTQQVFVTPKGMTRLAARLGQN
ncbi:phage antirepressor [Gluconacetobacter diazotrophicus]|uniref:phage antirepressor n=1 Tax=Gluconacetobacter diazotrophicus TaxID=33996 RepID=UPI00119A4076|nr:phage antirepressor KilAC domain-containing protein [Gluconacetobacter diazotrophicus]TWB00391.1 prophage antirepressor-like protein [Gluconacetobacter diazotrophicus]